jgi:hypothetical protein
VDDFPVAEIGIWNVTNDRPSRYLLGSVEYEKQLEEWIERNPGLIRSDLLIVGRQMRVESGVLDLLGIDKLGRWAVVEIKRGNVRRKTVMQALDYAACIAEMASDELYQYVDGYLKRHGSNLGTFLSDHDLDEGIFDDRLVTVYVVGTGRDPDLDRLVRNVTFQGNPISVVNFEVFENQAGERLLLRRLTEAATVASTQASVVAPSPDNQAETERLFELAVQNGVGYEFRRIYDAATKHGLYPRLYRWSVMYTPPQNKTRVIICAWVKSKRGHFDIYISHQAFAEFFPIGEREASRILEWTDRQVMTPDDVDAFVGNLDKLFARIEANS